jgi:hypothetical protein
MAKDEEAKYSAKEIEEAMKSRQKGEQEIASAMRDQVDFSKQIRGVYDDISKRISHYNGLLTNINKIIEDAGNKIKENNKKYEDIGKVIEENKKKYRATSEEVQESERKILSLNESRSSWLAKHAKETETLTRLNENLVKTVATLDGVNRDIAESENLSYVLSQKRTKNEESKIDLATQLATIQKTMMETGENNAHLDEIRLDLIKRQKINKLEGLMLEKQHTASLSKTQALSQEQEKLEKRRNEQLIHRNSTENNLLSIEEMLVEVGKQEHAEREKRAKNLKTQKEILNENKKLELDRSKILAENVKLEEKISVWKSRASKIKAGIEGLKDLQVFVNLIMIAYDRFVQLDKAAESFRRETGFSADQMRTLRSDAEAVNRQFQDMGVGVAEVYNSAKALTDVFGRTSLITKETLGNVALLSANLGVTEADSANVLANFQGLGKATQEAAMNVIKVGAGISEKAGVPFKLVMNDIANASEQTTAMLGANPSKLMKSAIAARALGTDMNKIVSSQRKLLDYSSSINDELELSALLGKSVSFQKSRQLAYDGDIAGAAKATLATVKAAGDFDKMNVYQREKLAVAAGMELKDLTKMMAVDKQRNEIMLGGDQAAKDKLFAQEEVLRNLEKENDLTKQSLVDQNEKAIRQQKIQGLVSNMTNTMESLLIALQDVFEPIIRIAMGVFVPIFKTVAALVRGLLSPIHDIGKGLLGNSEKMEKLGKFADSVGTTLVTWYELIEKIGKGIGIILYPLSAMLFVMENVIGVTSRFLSIFRNISQLITGGVTAVEMFASTLTGVLSIFRPMATTISMVMKGFAFVARYLGPIGLVVTAIQVAVDLVGQFMDIWSSDDMDIGEKILKSFVAIPKALYNVLVQPFIDMAAWLLNWMWPGVGDSMLKGIKSVGDAIFGVLKWPFQKMFGWFKNDSGIAGQSPSELGLMIVDGIKAIGSMLLDVITYPFRTAFNFISGIFGGDGNLGTSIVDGIKSSFGAAFDFITSAFSLVVDSIKNAASEIFGFITSPFKKALDFVKNIPFIGKLFGGNDIAAESKPQIDSTTMETAGVIEVKNLDALREVVQQLTDAVANLGKSDKTETLTAGTKIDTSALEDKLDKLTDLLVGGAVRVYLDGSDVSAAMSATGR